jgi:hypothetical protein
MRYSPARRTPIVKRLAMSTICLAALLVACDRDREPTAPVGPMAGGGNPGEVNGGLQADLGTVTGAPSWVARLLLVTNPVVANGASTQEELPGMGHKFELQHAMMDDQDPQNVTNDVISLFSTTDFPAGTGVAARNLPPGIKITALTNQLQLKYYFPSRTCQNGGPRIQLAIDTDGDGISNGNAQGYVGHTGFGGGCLSGVWDFVDLTDAVPARWDITQFGGGYQNWQGVVTFFTTNYPNHKVLTGSLVDDGCAGGGAAACGQAYYDLLTIENRTLENDMDTVH